MQHELQGSMPVLKQMHNFMEEISTKQYEGNICKMTQQGTGMLGHSEQEQRF